MLELLAQVSGPSRFQQLFDSLARTPLSEVLKFVAVLTLMRVALYPLLARVPPHRRGAGHGFLRFSNELLDAVIYAGIVVFLLIRPFGVQTFLIPSGSMLETLQINDFIIANKAVYRYSEPQRGDIVVFKPPKRALNQDQQNVDFIKRLVGKPGDVVEVRGGHLFRNGQRINEPFLRDQFIAYDWKLVKYEGSYEPWRGQYIPVTYRRGDISFEANWNTTTAKEFAIGVVAESIENQFSSAPRHWKLRDELTPAEESRMQELIDAEPAAVPEGYYLMMGDNRNQSYDSRGWGLVPAENVVGRSELVWFPVQRWGKTESQIGKPAE